MRHLILTTALFAAFAAPSMASAGQSAANKSEARSEVLAEDARVSDRIYDVRADGGRKDSLETVYDKALYKAAKKTLKENHDWFRVTSRENEKEVTVKSEPRSSIPGFERVPERRCGLLGCTTRYRTYYSGAMDKDFRQTKDTEYTVMLEFEMGMGPVSGGLKTYDAREIKRSKR